MDFFICFHRIQPERLRPKGESFGPMSLWGHLGRGEKEEHDGEEGAERLIPTGSFFGPQKEKGACSAAPMHSFSCQR